MANLTKARAIVMIVIGAIGTLASLKFGTYGADYYNDVLSSINWILRIISFVILATGIINLLEVNRSNNE
ncbi:MAG: hypothetical protein HDS07_02455 [Bacteroides sp.]|nr:hypothetical protein [Bacteroides sp.]